MKGPDISFVHDAIFFFRRMRPMMNENNENIRNRASVSFFFLVDYLFEKQRKTNDGKRKVLYDTVAGTTKRNIYEIKN